MQYPIIAITVSLIAFNAGGQTFGKTPELLTTVRYENVLRTALSLVDNREFTDASKLLESAAAQAAEQDKPEWEASILGFLGSIYQRSGRYIEAEDVLNKSIRELTELSGSESTDLIGPIANLGGLYYEARQYGHAEQLIARALEIQRRNDVTDPKVTAMLLTNLGGVYFSEHKDEQARESAEQALKRLAVVKKPGIEVTQSTARNYALLGALHLAAHEYPDAESCLIRARDLWEISATPDDPRRAESISNPGILYSHTGDFEKSESLFKQADAVFRAYGGNNAYLQHFFTEYYGAEKTLGHKKEAKILLKRLKQIENASAANTISRNVVDVSALK
jgi:tetratricopeptide (TPR) repeat protein